MMNQEQAYTAIINRMLAFIGIAQEYIEYPNAPLFTPPENDLWLRVNVLWGGSIISGLADQPCTRKTGVLAIQVFARPRTNEIELERMTDKLLSHFQYYSVDHLEFLQGQSSSTSNDGDYVMKNITVGFRVN